MCYTFRVKPISETHPHLASQWSPRNDLDIMTVSAGSHKKVLWVGDCGHEWSAVVKNRAQNSTGCPYCNLRGRRRVLAGFNDLVTEEPKVASEWHPTRNRQGPETVTRSSQKKAWWLGPCGHEWEAVIANRVRNHAGCPYCSRRLPIPGKNDLKTTHPGLSAEWDPERNNLTPGDVTQGNPGQVWWECAQGHSWKARVADRAKGFGCRQCSGSGISTLERALADYVSSLGVEVHLNDRSFVPGFEMDMILPGAKIAIEFNGVYWHSDRFKDRRYHLRKSQATSEAGFQLLHVWGDDWTQRPEVVKSMIARKIGVSSEARLNARGLDLRRVNAHEARDFLNKNHIQGFASGGLYLALKDDEIRSLAVFKGTGNPGEFTLVRFATNAIVRGGHSRLFKNAVRILGAKKVVTFADRGVSEGELYEKCGFQRDGELPPDYMYVVRGTREHKFNYRLDRFRRDPALKYEEGWSERDAAEANGLWRIYDAGKIRYVWRRSDEA